MEVYPSVEETGVVWPTGEKGLGTFVWELGRMWISGF